MPKKVLVIGSGGREHALCWKLSQSANVTEIFCAPGNGGTHNTAKTQNVPLGVSDFDDLIQFAQQHQIDLTVVGPDNPLAEGIVDRFQRAGLKIFGPTQMAARLESSKAFSKSFMKAHGLPTADFEVFDNQAAAWAFCQKTPWARVIKVDGLALGKGVYICDSLEDCKTALSEIFESKRFGDSGAKVIVEERLSGPEVSLMMLCDGQTLLPLSPCQDYKRRFDGNQGPNTGGMGAYSPVPISDNYWQKITTHVITPLERALHSESFTFQGLLYVGLMIHEDRPYILEFNARFGDPETQCLLPRLETDFFTLLESCVDGTLSQKKLQWSSGAAVCVVLTAENYPQKSLSPAPLSIGPLPPSVLLFQAGTKVAPNSQLTAQGGRILNMVGLGKNQAEAAQNAYQAIHAIHFEGMACRMDIAKDVGGLCLLK